MHNQWIPVLSLSPRSRSLFVLSPHKSDRRQHTPRCTQVLYTAASEESDAVFVLLESEEVPVDEGKPYDERHRGYGIAKFDVLLDETALRVTGKCR